LIRRAGELGIAAEDLDDLVHDIAGNLAAAVNNGGVDEQVQWLCEQLELGEVENHVNAIAGRKTQE